MKLYEKYFLKEILKIFFLLLASFYFLYILIDYSAHTKVFHQEGIRLFDIVFYYLCQWTKQADVLVPIALMIGVVKVLTSSNMRGEIVALISSGIPCKRLLYPFFGFALLCCCFLYTNHQFLQPLSMNYLHSFEESYFKSQGHHSKDSINSLILLDNSLLLYQAFDKEKQAFFDVYWIKDFDEIYRIKELFAFEKIPLAHHVDHLVRISSGELSRKSTFESRLFPEIKLDPKALFTAVHPPKWQSLTDLFSNVRWKGKLNDRESEIAAFFLHKLASPLICLLSVLGVAPLCLRFSRKLPVFGLYALSLFGIIAYFTLANACLTLGEAQIVSPYYAILVPPFFLFMLCGWRYAKL